jgi:hypothetical protein
MPFRLNFDTAKSVQMIFGDLIGQAIERQKVRRGITYSGTVLQHLIGAKLETINPDIKVDHHGASVADTSSARAGDFIINDTVIHVTVAPSPPLIAKCADNLRNGLQPIIVTTRDGARGGQGLARIEGIEERIEIIEFEQFMATNVHERASFASKDRRNQIERIIERYNKIIDEVESIPSLKINIT